jgi:hypothetical protein
VFSTGCAALHPLRQPSVPLGPGDGEGGRGGGGDKNPAIASRASRGGDRHGVPEPHDSRTHRGRDLGTEKGCFLSRGH